MANKKGLVLGTHIHTYQAADSTCRLKCGVCIIGEEKLFLCKLSFFQSVFSSTALKGFPSQLEVNQSMEQSIQIKVTCLHI